MTVDPQNLGHVIEQDLVDLVIASQPHQLLVSQAKRRMSAGGDSEHTYPELWDPPFESRRRKGDQPLLDTGRLQQSLGGRTELSSDGGTISVFLHTLLYGVFHQHGFETEGPNFIPLTNKARFHVVGANPFEEGLAELRGGEVWVMDNDGKRVTAESLGLNVEPDFIMAWGGVTVPQRKIFNLPREDRAELIDSLEALV